MAFVEALINNRQLLSEVPSLLDLAENFIKVNYMHRYLVVIIMVIEEDYYYFFLFLH